MTIFKGNNNTQLIFTNFLPIYNVFERMTNDHNMRFVNYYICNTYCTYQYSNFYLPNIAYHNPIILLLYL